MTPMAVCTFVSHLSEVADHRFVKSGSWDSIHVLEASSVDGKVFTYKLTTTVMLSMAVDNAEVGDTNLSGSVTRQVRIIYHQIRLQVAGVKDWPFDGYEGISTFMIMV